MRACAWTPQSAPRLRLLPFGRQRSYFITVPSEVSSRPKIEQIALVVEGEALFNEEITKTIFGYPTITISEVRHNLNGMLGLALLKSFRPLFDPLQEGK